MFKKHALQVKMVKTDPAETSNETHVAIDPEQIREICKDVIRHTTIAIGALIVTSAVATALKEIAIKKA